MCRNMLLHHHGNIAEVLDMTTISGSSSCPSGNLHPCYGVGIVRIAGLP